MYVGNLKRLCHLEIDEPIPSNIVIRAELLLVISLCGAHALNYINATGMKLTSINIVSRPVSF